MRIAIIATGSRGDVQPYVALGKGLVEAGHTVRLVTHQDFETLVAGYRMEFWPIKGSVQDIAQSAAMRELLEKGNFLSILSQMAKEARRGALLLAEAGLAACRGMDLILAGIGGLFTGLALGQKLNIPLLQAYYIPFTPTSAYPSFFAAQVPSWAGGLFNRFSYQLARQAMWQSFRSADGVARREALDLPTAPLFGPFNSPCVLKDPILYAYSPAVIPPPPDWPPSIHVTGYWFLDSEEGWTPPRALADFIQAGPPPVFIGFGSMSSRNPEKTAALILDALQRINRRAILLSGWGGLHKADVPGSVFMLDSAPFAWLFPRMAAVVHHGGAGTTSAGLRAGVPSVVIPFFGDQPYWGRRVEELGVGPKPIPRRQLSAARLAEAIEQAVTDEEMRQRAARLGEIIQAEDGVANAVAAIERLEMRGAG